MTDNGFRIDRKVFAIVLLFLIFLAGILIYKAFAGIILISAIIVFGGVALFLKEENIKLLCLAAIVLLSIVNIGINGVKFGIDFSGGTRIPVLLDKKVDQSTMNELVETIKKRVSVLGLSEVKVRAIGNTEISVELPSSDEQQIKGIENTLSQQGVFQGIVDGRVALAGEDIYRNSVRPIYDPAQLHGADWAVSFSITREGGQRFADGVKGKPNFPVYMFLDRPSDSILVISKQYLKKAAPQGVGEFEILLATKDALRLENDNIEVYFEESLLEDNVNKTLPAPKTNKTKALVATNSSAELKELLRSRGFIVKELSDQQITPKLSGTSNRKLNVESWEGVGLLSAPLLNPSVTEGTASYGYIVSGAAAGTTIQQKQQNALQSVKTIESVLKGGSLPVQISIGSRTVIPATFGSEFLRLSLIGIAAALAAIAILIAIRYHKIKIIAPILIISVSELVILISILGSFTIDLAAVAGIIAAIGVGVDAQIVITDELLKKTSASLEERIESAFAIVKTNAIVAMVAMLPLLFSGLVEIIGFAISTILGALLGFLLSRPAYAVLAEKILGEHNKQ